jgi:hypothetical protein
MGLVYLSTMIGRSKLSNSTAPANGDLQLIESQYYQQRLSNKGSGPRRLVFKDPLTRMAVLLVPPFIKYNAGPLLGPSLLQSAARRRGHKCAVVDLNAHWIHPRASRRRQHGPFLGDHDKDSSVLNHIETQFLEQHIMPALQLPHTEEMKRRANFGFLTHAQVETAGKNMASSTFGSWVRKRLNDVEEAPQVVGLSLLHAGQVVPAVAMSMVARSIWPDSFVVWGGPHMSGLGKTTLDADIERRAFAADMFVTGHAEETFVDILDATASGRLKRCSRSLVANGTNGRFAVSPIFENLEIYDEPLVLPAQSTLGCAYGRCTYCTYPAIEPKPTKLDLVASVGTVADLASKIGASVSIKDSLATTTRLDAIGSCIQGRARWSACTKLSSRLDLKLLTKLHREGLTTLEVGLESLLDETQKRVSKVQPPWLYENFVRDVASVPEMTLVVNYMVGFPWENPDEALAKLDEARTILENHLGGEKACIELNNFELERLAPMTRFPEAYGINRVTSWPWASVLEFNQ